MLLQQLIQILAVYHIGRRDDHILLRHRLEQLQDAAHRTDIGIVHIDPFAADRRDDLQPAALGIQIILPAIAQMLHQRTRIALHEHLDLIDAAVAHVGERKIDQAVASQIRERGDRAVFPHALHMHIRAFEIDDSICITHLTHLSRSC